EKDKKSFLRSLRQIQSSLESIGLKPKILDQEDWSKLVFEGLNLSRLEKIGMPSNLEKEDGASFESLEDFSPSLSQKVSLTDVVIHPDHLEIGDYLFRVITLAQLPESVTFAAMVNSFSSTPGFHFWIIQNIEICSQREQLRNLQVQR